MPTRPRTWVDFMGTRSAQIPGGKKRPSDASSAPKKTEALSGIEFPERRTGLRFRAGLGRLRLRFARRGRRRRRTGTRARILRRGKIAIDVVLADVEHHDLIRGHTRRAL